MQDLVVVMLKEINLAQLLAIGVMFWFFYSRLNAKNEKTDAKIDKSNEELRAVISKSETDLKEKIDKDFSSLDRNISILDKNISKLNEKVEDIDRRLCRIEGSLATHGHCLFNQSKPDQKAV